MVQFFLVALTILTLRYLIIAGGLYYVFWKWKSEKFASLKIQPQNPSKERIRSEILNSCMTFLFFAGVAALGAFLQEHGLAKLYFNLQDKGILYFIFTIALLLFYHDTYFYFAHRFMHLKFIYPYVHHVHHKSTNPTPFAAFSFHPLESFFEAIFLIPFVMIVPIHFAAIIIFLTISFLLNALGHLGYEIYPKHWHTHPILKWINYPTNHNDHHRYFEGNYGFYFSFWDRVLGTFKSHEDYKRS